MAKMIFHVSMYSYLELPRCAPIWIYLDVLQDGATLMCSLMDLRRCAPLWSYLDVLLKQAHQSPKMNQKC